MELPGVEPRVFGLATVPVLWHHATAPTSNTPQSCPYVASSSLLLIVTDTSCVQLLKREIIEQVTAGIRSLIRPRLANWSSN